jgi:hypothetical protein
MAARERWSGAISYGVGVVAGERIAAGLAGGAAQRQAAYAELEALARQQSGDARGATAIHVGGLEGKLEDEGALAQAFDRFGTVLAVTLCLRREVKHGRPVVSWALVSFRTSAEAQAAIKDVGQRAITSDLVVRKLDEAQAVHSKGAVREVIRKHMQARTQKKLQYRSVTETALVCVPPLLAVMAKDAAEVDADEYERAALIVRGLTALDLDRVCAACAKPGQPNSFTVLNATESVLGEVLAKQPEDLAAGDARIMICGTAVASSLLGGGGFDLASRGAGITSAEMLGEWMPAAFLLVPATPADDRNVAVAPLLVEVIRSGSLPDGLMSTALFCVAMCTAGRPQVCLQFYNLGLLDDLIAMLQQKREPLKWVSARRGGQPNQFADWAFCAVKDIVEGIQVAHGDVREARVDVTTSLLKSGYIDMMLEALAAAEQVGADDVEPWPVIYSALRPTPCAHALVLLLSALWPDYDPLGVLDRYDSCWSPFPHPPPPKSNRTVHSTTKKSPCLVQH